MPCNCPEKNAALAYQANSGFNEFIWLILIVAAFGVIMALLFFFCEILSKTQKLKKKHSHYDSQNEKAKLATMGTLPGTKSAPGLIIPTISQRVAQQQEMPDEKSGKPRDLFSTPPSPATKSTPTSYIATAPTMATGVTRTIPAYRSLSLVSSPMVGMTQAQTQKSSFTPPISSMKPISEPEMTQKLTNSNNLEAMPPMKPESTVDKQQTQARPVPLPPPKPMRQIGYQNSPAAIFGGINDKPQPMIATNTERAPVKIASTTANIPSSTIKVSAEVQTATNPTIKKQQEGSNRAQISNAKEDPLPTSDSSLLANSIMSRLLKGQEESDLLFRQIKSLESKVELLTWELKEKSKSPRTVTQSVQTNENSSKINSESMILNGSVTKTISNASASTETLQISNVNERSMQFSPAPAPSPREFITTTTYTISAEAIPKLQPPLAFRTTPIPPLLSHRELHQRETPSYDSVEESESLSYKSDSSDSSKLEHIQIQPETYTYSENEVKKQKIVEIQSGSAENINSRDTYNYSIQNEGLEEAMLRKQYEKSLCDTMSQLRADCQQRILENENEQRFLYSKREMGLQKEVGSLASSMQTQNSVLSSLQWKLSNLEKNISTIATEKILLENCAQGIKVGWEADKKIFLEDKLRLEELMLKMRAEKQELMGSYAHLLEIKVVLDSELAKYKMLVDEEENRHQFTMFGNSSEAQAPKILTQPQNMQERRVTFNTDITTSKENSDIQS